MTGGVSLQSRPWHLAAPQVLLSSSVKGDTGRESPTGTWSWPPLTSRVVSHSLCPQGGDGVLRTQRLLGDVRDRKGAKKQ